MLVWRAPPPRLVKVDLIGLLLLVPRTVVARDDRAGEILVFAVGRAVARRGHGQLLAQPQVLRARGPRAAVGAPCDRRRVGEPAVDVARGGRGARPVFGGERAV